VAVRVAGILNQGIRSNNIGVCAVNLTHAQGVMSKFARFDFIDASFKSDKSGV